jgi:hypothetical protein
VGTSAVGGANKFVKAVLNNWELAPLFSARTGQPLTVTTGTDNSGTDLGNDRPVQVMSDYKAANSVCSSSAICVQWINPAAFTPNAIGTYGDVGRNAVCGPGYFGFDLAPAGQPAGATYGTLQTALNGSTFG